MARTWPLGDQVDDVLIVLVADKIPLDFLPDVHLLLEFEDVLDEQIVQRLVREVDAQLHFTREEGGRYISAGRYQNIDRACEMTSPRGVFWCLNLMSAVQFTCGNELTPKFSKPKMSRTPVQNAALYTDMYSLITVTHQSKTSE